MRVPVRRQPETRIGEQQQGYARPVEPLNIEPVTRLVEGVRDQILAGQDDRQRIDLNRRLVTEVNELQADFTARQTNPKFSSDNFADDVNQVYNQRHTELMNELRQQGYSHDLLEDFDTRLGAVRQGFYERGLAHQVTQLDARAVDEVTDLATQVSQYVAADPTHNYATGREMLENAIRTHPDLTEARRDALRSSLLAVVNDGGSRAAALMDPQGVVNLLDPNGVTAPYAAPPATSGTTAAGAPPAREQFMRQVRQAETGNDDHAVNPQPGQTASGRYQFTRRTWINLHRQVVGGNMTDDQRWAQRFDNNLQDRLMNEATDTYERVLSAAHQPITAGTLYLSHFVGPERAVRILQNPNAPISSVMTPQEIRVNPPLRRMQTVGQIAAWTDRQMGTVQTASSNDAPAFRPAPTGTQVASASPAPRFIDQPPEQGNDATAPAPETKGLDLEGIHTGNPLIDALNGPERMQLLARARERLNQVNATQRAEMDVRIGNITAEALNNGGEIAAPLPTEQEVLQTYGPVEGPQRWAQITQSQATGRAIVTFRTQSAESIQRALQQLTPAPGSPTYQTQLQIYQAAERAAQSLLAERERDPAAYAMRYFPQVGQAARQGTAQYYAALDRVYQTLGIDPNSAPVMTADNAQRLTRNYQTMSPQARGDFIRQNMEEMGEDRFRRFVHGMEGTTAETDARIYALLRSYPGAGPSRILYNQILEGREIIAQDPARRPRSEEVLKVFRAVGLNAVRDLNPETSRSIQEAAEGLYAQRGGDPVHVNQSLYREALTAVLGGNLPADMRRGAVTDYTILPPRVSEQQFRSWMERQTMQTLIRYGTEQQAPRWGDLRTPVPMQSIIDEGVFVMVSPGYYAIRMASDGRPLMTPNGNRYIMRIDARGLMNIGPSRAEAVGRRILGGGLM